jgi:hypothetical protein
MFHVQQLFSRQLRRLWDNVEKYGRARQATDDNIYIYIYIYRRNMDNEDSRYTLRLRNIYRFSKTTIFIFISLSN